MHTCSIEDSEILDLPQTGPQRVGDGDIHDPAAVAVMNTAKHQVGAADLTNQY